MRACTREIGFVKLREECIGLLLGEQITRANTGMTRNARSNVVNALVEALLEPRSHRLRRALLDKRDTIQMSHYARHTVDGDLVASRLSYFESKLRQSLSLLK
jgi:hypothetical protein